MLCRWTGDSLGAEDLPRPRCHWTVGRKARVVSAVDGGLLSEHEARERYRLSPDELNLWREALDRFGVPGLRVTRIKAYRLAPA